MSEKWLPIYTSTTILQREKKRNQTINAIYMTVELTKFVNQLSSSYVRKKFQIFR